MTPLRPRPIWGTVMGLLVAALLLLFLLLRTRLYGYNAFETGGASTTETVQHYLLAGAIGGLLFGLLLPLAQRGLGAALLGVLVIAPFFTLQAVIATSSSTGEDIHWWSVIGASVIVGGLAGYVARHTVFGDLDSSADEDPD